MKTSSWIFLSVVVVLVAYRAILFDTAYLPAASFTSFIVSLVYIGYWAFFTYINRRKAKVLPIALFVSGLSCVSGLVLTVINFGRFAISQESGMVAYVLVFFVCTFFAVPLYGLSFLVRNSAWCMLVITMLTGGWCGYSAYLYYRLKYKKNTKTPAVTQE